MAGFVCVIMITSLFLKHSTLQKDKLIQVVASETNEETAEADGGHGRAAVQHNAINVDIH